jgi:hypothetical protein
VGFVLQTFRSLLGPPSQDPVDGGAADPEVAGDRLRAPAVGVQRHDRRTGVLPHGDLVVGWEASHEPQRYGLFREHALHRLAGGAPPEAHVADARELDRVEAGILGLQVHDETPDGGRQPLTLGRLRAEEALHPLRLEAGHLPPQRAPGGRPGLLGPPVRRGAKQHQRSDQLVVPLLGPPAQELDLLPLVGRLDAPSKARPALHTPPSSRAPLRRGWKDATNRLPRPGIVPLCVPDITARSTTHSGE